MLTVNSNATARMMGVAKSTFSFAIASRAFATLMLTLRPLDRKNAMRFAVTDTYDPSSSSSSTRIRDCRPTFRIAAEGLARLLGVVAIVPSCLFLV